MNSSILAGITAAILSLFGVQHSNTYVDPTHRFSFELPANETVLDLPTASGAYETLIFEGDPNGAQIVITPWTGDASYPALETEYTYLADPPYQGTPIMESSFQGAAAISFKNQTWFSHGGYLYVAEGVPPVVLSSWRF